MSTFLNLGLWPRQRKRGTERDSDIELGQPNHMAQTTLQVQHTPTTVSPRNPTPQHPNTLVTSAGSFSMVPERASQFVPAGMPPQVQQVHVQIEKRRREDETLMRATKLRAVEGPTASLVDEEIRRREGSTREALDADYQQAVDEMKADNVAIGQEYEEKIESLKAEAMKREGLMRNEVDKAKKDAEDAQSEVDRLKVEGTTREALIRNELDKAKKDVEHAREDVDNLKAEAMTREALIRNELDKAKKDVEHAREDVDNLKAEAMTRETLIRNELDKAKKDAEHSQKENMEFRGLLGTLQKEIDQIKAGTATVTDGDAMIQDEGELIRQYSRDIAQLKLDSEATAEEHKKEMAEMKSQLAEFSGFLKQAQETIGNLQGQLKATEERATRAESENLKYRDEIAALTSELEERVVERAVAPSAGNSSSTSIQRQQSPQNNPKVASQHDVNMVEDETPGNTDDEMYASDDNHDDDMNGNATKNVQPRNSEKSQPKVHREKPSADAGVPAMRHRVPPPQKVVIPRGGQGTPTKIVLNNPWSNRANQEPVKRVKHKKTYIEEALQGLFELDAGDEVEEEDMEVEDIDGDEDEDEDGDDESDGDQGMAERRKGRDSKRLNVFSNPKLRGHNPKRAKIMTMVRKLMNQILDMAKDTDIIKVELAAPEEVKRYEDDQSILPTSEGFRPTFVKGFWTTEWHLFLEEAFVDRFVQVHRIKLEEKGRDCIAILFRNRLIRLRKKLTDLKKDMTPAERKAWKARADSMCRKNVRRLNDWDFRRSVCLENIETPDGGQDEGWLATLEMIERLGPAGMSSDESDVQNGKLVYFVRKRAWRSAEATGRVMLVDGQRNTSNGAGKPRPGNPARVRIRSTQNGHKSTRDPTVGCPANLYDAGYVKGLSNLRRRALKMAPAMDLGYIDDA